jgi:hypothetical protein
MTTPTPIDATALILALRLDDAPSDAARAEVLGALVDYARMRQDAPLAAALQAQLPAAHPRHPPEAWADSYAAGFEMEADEDRGVYMDEMSRYRHEYWGLLADEQRRERLAFPQLGHEDGRKDAEGLNEA